MSETIRVYICDDHPLVRRGIRDLLETETAIEVVGEGANGQDAVREAGELKPDVVLMDLMMPVLDGIAATRQIRDQNPHIQILVLTSFTTDEQIFPAIKAGALGYLIKDTGPDELVEAIRKVHRGEASLHPTIAQRILQEVARPAVEMQTADPLSAREMDVLKLIARGMSNQQIAEQLVVSVTTVYTHVSNILGKLHLASRTQAALYALREGYASLEEFDDPDL